MSSFTNRKKSSTDFESRYVVIGKSNAEGCNNSITTSRYNIITFLPMAIREQFRRYGNIYFLVMGGLMWIGKNTTLFDSAIDPWTTLGPLCVVVSISLFQEGWTDLSRHRSDSRTNNFPCLLVKRSDEVSDSQKVTMVNGIKVDLKRNNAAAPHSPEVSLVTVKRADMHAGDFVLVRNREMVPADVVLLASSNENGSVYIETSSIDGETNLKLRNCPDISIVGYSQGKIEKLEEAITRVVSYGALKNPNGKSALDNPLNTNGSDVTNSVSVGENVSLSVSERLNSFRRSSGKRMSKRFSAKEYPSEGFVAALTSELPNASVNTFSGKLTLPPLESDSPSSEVPLGAENLLLRGAILRNTEWAIGVACFTGKDTKLVQNSVETPSKLSQLDVLVNMTIVRIFFGMIILAILLAGLSRSAHSSNFDDLWYLGFASNVTQPWPYLEDLEPVKWETESTSFPKMFLTFITLNNNFIPLSLYVSIEMLTAFFMWMINTDKDMYNEETDLPAAARSTIVSDLGQIKYIFSDKTGTLTQNIMSFKRCSVDGVAYGSPMTKQKPQNEKNVELEQDLENFNDQNHSPDYKEIPDLLAETIETDDTGGNLSFNAEMFLRVMSICHTVVVEKDYDANNNDMVVDSIQGESNSCLRTIKNVFKEKKKERSTDNSNTLLEPNLTTSKDKNAEVSGKVQYAIEKNSDGAPLGYAYQAESPDEGALVSAASLQFGFQLFARESGGIRLKCSSPSMLQNAKIVEELKTGKTSSAKLATRTALLARRKTQPMEHPREELWSVLAVNKFDSDRKRMSILVRSPPELGSIPILLCKGADSAMLNSSVCEGANMLIGGVESSHEVLNQSMNLSFSDPEKNGEKDGAGDNDWKINVSLSIQAHLGDFASEGLRTLVLGIRVLSEDECYAWLKTFESAATSIKNRAERLKKAAIEIESKIHIVGATAIEDELQEGVPETIAKLAEAGIKLWVLTGDKRETAIEIGYSTKVLTPDMRLIEVADAGPENVKFLMATEFLKLVKKGYLPMYQKAALGVSEKNFFQQLKSLWKSFLKAIGLVWQLVVFVVKLVFKILNFIIRLGAVHLKDEDTDGSKKPADSNVRRRAVRELAESIIETHKCEKMSSVHSSSIASGGGSNQVEIDDEDNTEDAPRVFNRAASAKAMLLMRSGSALSSTSEKVSQKDEDLSSMKSVVLNDNLHEVFLKKKRTVFEAIFAVDKEVRHGRLQKHLNPEFIGTNDENVKSSSRALVIEGGALIHLLGDPILEQMLFDVASNCDSVIACRVSPKQKALVVNLVRNYISPEPITLAIGDGANDVGMIQEAHVGVGISGLEGQQAVNSSDFAISQFRFLQELLLIHGRWNFMRMSKLVLFSFYKNAVLVGVVTYFSSQTLYSGTPVYDQWVIAMLNFVAGIPIIMSGSFDRDLDKDYVRKHPEVYASGLRNEFLNLRMISRWTLTVILHTLILGSLSFPSISLGGGQTPGSHGLMRGCDSDHPGEGEGGDLTSVGVVMFTCFVLTLAYKVAYETRLFVIGEWLCPCTCRQNKGEGWPSRISYTFLGTFWLSIMFWFSAIYLYSFVGTVSSDSEYIPMAKVPEHVFGIRSISWILIFYVPIVSCMADVILKLFANMYFPTQTQIHMEIQKFGDE